MNVVNDILGYDLKLYQNQDWFCFSIDSVILANFARIKGRTKRILDIGCGNGVIPLILSLRTKAFIEGVEIQKDLADLATESVNYNKLSSKINIYNQNINDFVKNVKVHDLYDLVVCNPPFFKVADMSTKNYDIHKVIARHETYITFEEIAKNAFILLKERGSFSTVNRVERFIEVITILKKYNLEPKYVRFVYDNVNIAPNMFYIEAIKCGKEGLIIDKPFIMYDNNIKTCEYENLIKEVM